MDQRVEREIARLIGQAVNEARPVSGGDVAAAYRVVLDDGTVVFAKTKTDADPAFFATEAAGLSWLAEPAVVPVPQVLGVGERVPLLILQWIEPGRPAETTEADFGRSLAELHRSGATSFGRARGQTTGSLELPNDAVDSWAEALGENRLAPLASIGRQRHSFPTSVARSLQTVAGQIGDLVPIEPPARLHGDLWAGNRMIGSGGQNWLIDPAATGGHREHDLAMMELFGGFGAACFAAYDEAFPLEPGWRDRIPLHQLAPLAVHAIKFGGGYVGGLQRALAAIGR